MTEGPWGESLQSGFPTEETASSFQGRAFPYAERGVVLKVHTRDAATNYSKSFVECDVLLVQLMFPLKNVPVAQVGYGANGVEWVPVAPTKPLSLDKPKELAQQIRDTDADFVIVDFLGGREPVIRGQLPRPRAGAAIDLAGYSAVAADVTAGKGRVKGRVGGTTWEIDKDGNVTVTLASDKELKLVAASGNEIEAKTDSVILSRGTGTQGVARLNDSVAIGGGEATVVTVAGVSTITSVTFPVSVTGHTGAPVKASLSATTPTNLSPSPTPYPAGLAGTINSASSRVKAGG